MNPGGLSISIITATFNSAATLDDTLLSINSQNAVEADALIQDGLSKDATIDIANGYPFVTVRSEKDTGLYNAMNRGVNRATGDIIGILNSDDFYPTEDVLATVLQTFTDHPETDAVYGDLNYVAEKDTTKVVRTWKAGAYDKRFWKRGWMPPHPTFFVRREVYQKFGRFNEDFRFAADYEFMLRCCYKHDITVRYIPKVLVHMRVGGVSNSSFANRLKANREDVAAWRVNNLPVPLLLNIRKPMRKVNQFFKR